MGLQEEGKKGKGGIGKDRLGVYAAATHTNLSLYLTAEEVENPLLQTDLGKTCYRSIQRGGVLTASNRSNQKRLITFVEKEET